ncbi:MAG: energy transducer TonB [Gammaproteobacteria bacterium]|nr:energy transducer TonB [Gammaproteobacteria bacterium]
MAIAGKKPEIKILMLSSDQEFLGQVTDAVEDRYALFHAKNLKQALDFDQLGQVALLIADSELLTGEPAPVLERLSRRAPGMVPVIAGTAREKPLLQKMMSEGKIFRVLTKPCQPGQTRLYIEAAVKQAMQMRGVDHIVEKSSERSWKKPVLIVGSIAAVLMSVSFVIPWVGDKTEGPDDYLDPGHRVLIGEHLDMARSAMGEKRYFEPKNNNAIYFYYQILSLDPDNVSAQRGIMAAADEVLAQSEQDLLQNRPASAAKALVMIRNVLPDHPRLAFFDSLVGATSPEQRMSNARRAIDAGQYEQAFGLLAEVSAGDSATPPAMEKVVLGGVLEHARAAISSGEIGRALDLIDRVKVINSSYGGIAEIEDHLGRKYVALMSVARTETDNGNLDTAENALRQAESIPGAGVSSIRQARSRISKARKAMGERAVALAAQKRRENQIDDRVNALNREFRASIADNRLVAPRKGNALFFLNEMQKLNPESRAYLAGSRELTDILLEQIWQDLAAREYAAAESLLKQAEQLAGDNEDVSAARSGLEKDWAAHRASVVIPVTQMIMTNFVQPEFPKRALRRNIEGWVDVEFTVTIAGEVSEIEIIGAKKTGYFEKATQEAVAQWRFEPQIFRGEPQEQRVSARLQFNL